MKLAGRRELPFPRQAVWAALMDPDVLSRTLPGCERLERTGEGSFAGTLAVAVGPVRGRFDGTLALTEVQPPEGYRMKLHGEGPSGFLSGEGTVRLEDSATEGGTVVVYDLEAQVGGRIAGVGQRLLDSSAKVIARQGLDGLERQLAARHGAVPGAAGTTPGGAGSAAVATATAADAAAVADAVPGPTANPPADSAAAAWGVATEPPSSGAAANAPSARRPAVAEPPSPSPAAVGTAAPEPASPAAAAPGPLPPAPTQGEFAGQFLRGLWEELVPPAARPWVVAGAVLLLALLVALLAWLLT
ncbi:MAG TPA: SRPBCC domain-containing protein [Thermoanaerobaculia bacterium]|nr:SRPBCC domain-containing protein [Thermoanaerobaculia bacterium]